MRAKYRVIERLRDKYPVQKLCSILEVTRSGYYAWRKKSRQSDPNQWIEEQIRICQQQSKNTYGYRRVQKWIEKQEKKHVNAKRILRIMRKMGALSKIRRSRAYRFHKQSLHRYGNLLNRQFSQKNPNKFWATDITYIPTAQGMAYMCAVIDLCGKMILSYRLGTDMTTSLVLDTISLPSGLYTLISSA